MNISLMINLLGLCTILYYNYTCKENKLQKLWAKIRHFWQDLTCIVIRSIAFFELWWSKWQLLGDAPLRPMFSPITLRQLCTSLLLRHSFYLYFYFEHLNFTWSYLIDMKISWSLDHIFWSYLGDLISWSTILSWSLDLIIWWWSKICFFYIITYMHLTCLWLMSFIDDQHAFTLHLTCFGHMFTCVYLEDNTWTLVYNRS